VLLFFIFVSCDATPKDTTSVVVETPELDADGDGFISSEDCDDLDPHINAGATEVCDGLDNNCNGDIDEGVLNTYYLDSDGDGFGNTELTIQACEPPQDYVVVAHDCDDSDSEKYPGSETLCDDLKTALCSSGGHISGSSFQGTFCLSPVNLTSGGAAAGTDYIWQPSSIRILSE